MTLQIHKSFTSNYIPLINDSSLSSHFLYIGIDYSPSVTPFALTFLIKAFLRPFVSDRSRKTSKSMVKPVTHFCHPCCHSPNSRWGTQSFLARWLEESPTQSRVFICQHQPTLQPRTSTAFLRPLWLFLASAPNPYGSPFSLPTELSVISHPGGN